VCVLLQQIQGGQQIRSRWSLKSGLSFKSGMCVQALRADSSESRGISHGIPNQDAAIRDDLHSCSDKDLTVHHVQPWRTGSRPGSSPAASRCWLFHDRCLGNEVHLWKLFLEIFISKICDLTLTRRLAVA
jgi:hypothetical protein